MALDALVDSTQLDSDLTSVANAIRTKGGTSAQLAFPAGFVSAVNAISGGSGNSVFEANDVVMPSSKFSWQNSLPNVLADGGCIHYKYTLQANTNTSNDRAILCFGYGALSAWSPGTSNPSAYVNIGKGTSNMTVYLRGVSNVNIYLHDYAQNGEVDIKLYSDHMFNVKTGNTISYTAAQQDFFTALAAKSYLSVGCNQSDPLTGAVITKFALEDS